MKRTIFAILLSCLCMLALSACSSAGIIGGADGPTEIIVSGPDTDTPTDTPRDLTAAELKTYEKFLNQGDVNGFLMSTYETPLDADYFQVFYTGAGVELTPAPERIQAYLDAHGYEELYTDITFISPEGMDQVIRRRTGHTLEEVLEHGNSLTRFLEEDGTYVNMHGDTNRFPVYVQSGTWNGDGTVTVYSQDTDAPEGYDPELLSANTFTTVLKTGDEPLIVSNEITGGWMMEVYNGDYGEIGPVELTVQRPPFDGYYHVSGTVPEDDTLPVTLALLQETEEGSSLDDSMTDWNPEATWDIDEFYRYEIEDGQYPGELLRIYGAGDGELLYSMDFSSFLFSEGQSIMGGDLEGLDAQSLRWARIANGTLYVASAHPTYAETTNGQNAYLTAVDLYDGSILWRSEPLVCNSHNFVLAGVDQGGTIEEGVILCGYGFTNEDDYLYQISLETGQVLSRTPLATKADWLAFDGNTLMVQCYNRLYLYDVSYG